MLTWLKLFKWLNFFPSMQILTRTLNIAVVPLAWFSVIFLVMLIGAGQGFFLAFGLDMKEFRTFWTSCLALTRMAVGDFDYDQLEASHQFIGPILFWMYIFLVFFILMSVFIALISESYEEAKEQLSKQKETGLRKRIPTKMEETLIRHDVRNKLKQCQFLVSPQMYTLMHEAVGDANEGK